MCFWVRFSLYLASCLPDFDHLFSVCVVWGGGGGIMWGPEKKGGGDQPKKRGGLVPLFPPPPGSAYVQKYMYATKYAIHSSKNI